MQNSMQKKTKYHLLQYKNLIKAELLKEFIITEPIAVNFVPEHLIVDMYMDDSDVDEGRAVTYITLGASQEYSVTGWCEVSFCLAKRLNYSQEQSMLKVVSDIICELCEERNFEEDNLYPIPKELKEEFGYDYFVTILCDMDFRNLDGNPILVIGLTPIYESELNHLIAVDTQAFMEDYFNIIPDNQQMAIDVKREPMNL